MLVLASGSPRRKELLKMAGIPFHVLVSQADETLQPGTSPERAVLELSRRKAQAVAQLPESADRVILAADTVVSLQGKIYGKPSTESDAARMLRALSGRIHQVFTGVSIYRPQGGPISFFEQTNVEFYSLTEQEIFNYVATGEPMDKAGGYGIQGRGALLVKAIEGDFYNVMGLPIARVARALQKVLD